MVETIAHLKSFKMCRIFSFLLPFYFIAQVAPFDFFEDYKDLFSDKNRVTAFIHDDVARFNNLSINYPPSHGQLTAGCRLVCFPRIDRLTDNLWICQWRTTKNDCHSVTREIMRNAETVDPEIPYLRNASTRPRFSIALPRGDNHLRFVEFEDGFLSDFPDLFFFILHHSPFEKIKAKMFRGAENLRRIEIFGCSLFSEIEDGAFENLTSLQAILLDFNALTKINASTFKNLLSLQKMQIICSKIGEIHKDAFIDLSQLKVLMLHGNEISSLDSDTFKNLRNLESLTLYKNKITSLPKQIFQGLVNLENIGLYQNPLSHLHTGMFNYSKRPQGIFVGCNPVEDTNSQKTNMTIDKGSLSTKSRARFIVVGGCVTDLRPSALEGVNTLILAIWDNFRVDRIRRNIFKGLRGINDLTFHGNNIETLQNDTFQDAAFTRLQSLDLSKNKIKTILNGTLSNLKQLNLLNLSSNLMTIIFPHFFEEVSLLSNLDLHNNQIVRINGNAFLNLRLLIYLSLGQNQLSNLSLISFQGLVSLKHLDLSSNRLKMISYGDLDFDFDFDNYLRTLLLQQNQITKVEGFQAGLIVRYLDLSKNNLTSLENSFISKNSQIFTLNLSENKLKNISKDEFLNLGIKELLLDKNRLQEMFFILGIESDLESWSLGHLDISHNLITEVSGEIRKKLQKINDLNITNNPWKCSCSLPDRDLMQFLLSHRVFSCCPKLCQCFENADTSIYMNCSSQNLSSLPHCLPYQRIQLDYSNNFVRNLSFTRNQDNVSYLDVSQNSITSIDGASLNKLQNLTFLNLKSNLLRRLPNQVAEMRGTKIYLEDNEFLCSDCSLVETLRAVMKNVPQDITCANEQSFYTESLICMVEFSIAPYSFLSFVCVILIIMVYSMGKLFYIKKLRTKYEQKTVLLHSKEVKKAYKQECTLLQEIDHRNIRKMYTYLTTRIPFVKSVGHLFLEMVECSLGEFVRTTEISTDTLNTPSLMTDLISAMDYLHSREYPICHRHLGIDAVYLQKDTISGTFILKIGDFSWAKMFVPFDSADESTPLVNSSDEQIDCMREDLRAVAKISFVLFTKKEKDGTITEEEIMELPAIEYGILILALQEGMTAAEALQAAPFHSAEWKKSILGELNAYLKRIKNVRKSAGILRAAEENAHLVIGGKGAWSKLFEIEVLEEFALLFNGYDITSFVDLLRLIRNMLEHGHECPISMEAAFRTAEPTPEKMFLEYSRKFPYFYLHSLLCYYAVFEERTHAMSDVFMTTYRTFENFKCLQGLARGSLLPLQEKSSVLLNFKSVSDDVEDMVTQSHTRSCIGVNDIFPEMLEKTIALWPDFPVADVIFKHRENVIQNPYSNVSSVIPDFAATSKVLIPEGSTIKILKPELLVQLPDKVVSMTFKPTDNVKAIRGLAMKHLTPDLRKKVKPKSIGVTLNDNPLKTKDRLVDLDFTNVALIVKYPHMEI